jgi:hypothetical protein
MLRLLMFLVGAVFVGGSGLFIVRSFDSRNLLIAALWSCFGLAVGVFLCAYAILGDFS